MEAVSRPPVELKRKGQQHDYECKVTLPLPPQLLIFSQGSWPGEHGMVKMDIFINSKYIGTMTDDTKCFSWEVKGLEDRPSGERVPLEMKVVGWMLADAEPKTKKEKKPSGIQLSKERSKPQDAKENKETKLRTAGTSVLSLSRSKSKQTEEKDEDQKEEETPSLKINKIDKNETSLVEQKCKTSPLTTVLIENTTSSNKKIKRGNSTPTTDTQMPRRARRKTSLKKEETPLAPPADKRIFESSNTTVSAATDIKKTKQTQLNFGATSKKATTDSKSNGQATKKRVKHETLYQTTEKACVKPMEKTVSAKSTSSDLPSSLTTKQDGNVTVENDGSDNFPNQKQKRKTPVADGDSRSEAQIHNETTPQVPVGDIHSPLMKRSAKKKRLQSNRESEKSPEGPTPKKRGICMRAGTGESGTPRGSRVKIALADAAFPDKGGDSAKSGIKYSEGRMTRYIDLSMRTPRPTARWGHTMLLTDPRCAVLIGGQGDKQQLSKDSIWTLNTETRKWDSLEVQSEGQKPEYRMGHTATYDPTMRCIYIFGGSKNSRWFHDVHVYDLDENKWSLAKVSGKAPTRAYHTASLHRHELWVFGGVYPRPDPNPDGCSNEVHIFSPVMQSWYTPLVQGEKPVPRSGHSATLISDQLIIFGGWDAPFCYNDLFLLDLTTVDWSKPDVKGTPPKPRCWHASGALGNRRTLIHGGYDGDFALEDSFIFDLNALSWSRLVIEFSPKARAGHAAVCLPYRHENQEEDEVLVFGGGDNDGGFFSELQSYSIPFNPVVELS